MAGSLAQGLFALPWWMAAEGHFPQIKERGAADTEARADGPMSVRWMPGVFLRRLTKSCGKLAPSLRVRRKSGHTAWAVRNNESRKS